MHIFRPVENLPEISSRCQMEPLHFEDHDVVKQRARLSFPQPRGFFGPFMGVERSTGELSVEIGKVILLVGKPLDCIYIYIHAYCLYRFLLFIFYLTHASAFYVPNLANSFK